MLRNALEGLTVIDFTQIGAGPTCTMLLGDMGRMSSRSSRPKASSAAAWAQRGSATTARCSTRSIATSSACAWI